MKLHASQLKWLALVTMTIDHIGAYLFPQHILFRVIGRLAFPIYAFLIAQGYSYTKNKFHYALRLLVFAVATQLLFLVFEVDFVNVLFTFFLALVALYCVDRNWLWGVGLVILITNYFNPDYTVYGVALVMLFYLNRNSKMIQILGFTILTIVFTCLDLIIRPQLATIIFGNLSQNWGFFIQLFALGTIPFLLMYDGKKGKTIDSASMALVSKYFFYVYYPLHIVVLVILQGGI